MCVFTCAVTDDLKQRGCDVTTALDSVSYIMFETQHTIYLLRNRECWTLSGWQYTSYSYIFTSCPSSEPAELLSNSLVLIPNCTCSLLIAKSFLSSVNSVEVLKWESGYLTGITTQWAVEWNKETGQNASKWVTWVLLLLAAPLPQWLTPHGWFGIVSLSKEWTGDFLLLGWMCKPQYKYYYRL